jgi:hypothetical protein
MDKMSSKENGGKKTGYFIIKHNKIQNRQKKTTRALIVQQN